MPINYALVYSRKAARSLDKSIHHHGLSHAQQSICDMAATNCYPLTNHGTVVLLKTPCKNEDLGAVINENVMADTDDGKE